jgi:hypothetical protein
MAMHGYVGLAFNAALTSIMQTANGQQQLWDAVDDLNTYLGNLAPQYMTQVRLSTAKDGAILECLFPSGVTKAQLVTAAANRFGVSEATVNNQITQFAIFGGAGATWAESRQAASNYLEANAAAWGEGA